MNADQIEPVIASYMVGVTSKVVDKHSRIHENMWHMLHGIFDSPDYTTMRDLYNKFLTTFYAQSVKHGFTQERTYAHITNWVDQAEAFEGYTRAMNLVLASYKPDTIKNVSKIVSIERTCAPPFPEKAKQYLSSFYA